MAQVIPEPHLAQVALSVADMPACLRFYTNVLGFRLAGGRYAAGPGLAHIQGLEDPACIMWWLINDQPFFQLELFQYTSPAPTRRQDGWRPCDIGYTRLTFAVADVAATVALAAANGGRILTAPNTVEAAVRACVLDPTGVPIELVEARYRRSPQLVSVAASVSDLPRSALFFSEALGLTTTIGKPGDREALWGLPGAAGYLITAMADGIAMELTAYTIPEPAPRRDGFQLNDHGILNVALGYRDWQEFSSAYGRVTAGGYRRESAPMGAGGAYDVSYVTDGDGFSVELLYCPRSSDVALGFALEVTP